MHAGFVRVSVPPAVPSPRMVRPSSRSSLPLHRDGSVLSFNVLLNKAGAFAGGGTYFEALDATYRGEQGDAVMHSGRLRHAGALVTRGERFVLVGFVDVVEDTMTPTADTQQQQ